MIFQENEPGKKFTPLNRYHFARLERLCRHGLVQYMLIHVPLSLIYDLDMTPQARIKLSVYPANSVCPSALQAKLTHSGSRLFFPTAV